jgi:isocitrate lyase
MAAYSELQQAEFASEPDGYTATRHQREVGTGWFDAVATTASGGKSSTTALAGSTETEQFYEHAEHTQPAPQRDAMIAAAATDHDHDDGLVHAHGWAKSPDR